MKILANDGIDAAGKNILEAAGFEVITTKIPQSELASKISDFDVLIVRSATKVTAEILDSSNLKLIARAGVGLDNIDIKHAGLKNIPVVNTPNASSRSVAELVFSHLFSLSRSLHLSNRVMPNEGIERFAELKKICSNGFELKDKTIGIIGFGRIGQEVAKIAIGLGMNILVADKKSTEYTLTISLSNQFKVNNFSVSINSIDLDTILQKSDFITIHTPGSNEVIGEVEIEKMKTGAILINCARGGVVNEKALINALISKKVSFAGVDVFEHEPPIDKDLLSLENVSLSPHIGASTAEAQERVGIELAERICQFFK